MPALADRLQMAGINRLALQLDNGLPWALIDLACTMTGVVVIPIPHFFSLEQQEWLLESSGADALIGPHHPGWQASDPLQLVVGELPLWRRTPARLPPLPTGTAKITYTSGTTGQPKGVCLSLAQMMAVCASLAERVAPANVEKHLTLLPLTTLLENLTGLYVPLLTGACSRIPSLAELGFTGSSKLDPATLAQALLRWPTHSLVLVPELLRLLLALCSANPARWRAAGRPALRRGGRRQSLARAHQPGPQAGAAGLRGIRPVGVRLRRGPQRPRRPQPGQRRPATAPLPGIDRRRRRDPGGGSRHAMLGYLGSDEPTPVLVATGDLGHLDEEGYLHITGRKKNVQITAFGRNFSPEWVEAEAQLCPAIARIVIFGDGQPANVALIQPLPGADAQLAQQIEQLNHRLPDYARIHHWLPVALDQHPELLTANGRPRRERIYHHFSRQISQCLTGETS